MEKPATRLPQDHALDERKHQACEQNGREQMDENDATGCVGDFVRNQTMEGAIRWIRGNDFTLAGNLFAYVHRA